jgi:signal transduction histidine kinase
MAGSTETKPKHTFTPDFNPYAALYITIAAFSIVTLVSTPSLWQNGRWVFYIIGVLLFAALADRCARQDDAPVWQIAVYLGSQTVLLIFLIILSDYYFLTGMLSFISVSMAQSNLPRRQALMFDVMLLAILALTFGLGGGLNATLQVILGLGAGFVFMIAFTQLARSERRAREDLQKANTQLAEYAGQVEQLATVRERNRLAREVHDTLGHYLTVINVQLEIVTRLIDSNPARAKEAAAKAKELASEGLSEVRRSVSALRPSPLEDKPLPEAIRSLIEASRDAGLMVTFEQTGAVRSLSPEMETVLYRAAQESLTNIRKHAHASAANVCLTYDMSVIRLRVRDNGMGRKGDEDNVGLSALRERVATLNGTVLAENHLEGGFVLEVTLPIERDAPLVEVSR